MHDIWLKVRGYAVAVPGTCRVGIEELCFLKIRDRLFGFLVGGRG